MIIQSLEAPFPAGMGSRCGGRLELPALFSTQLQRVLIIAVRGFEINPRLRQSRRPFRARPTDEEAAFRYSYGSDLFRPFDTRRQPFVRHLPVFVCASLR